MKREIGCGHDARVERIEIHEGRLDIWFEHLELYVEETPGVFGVWACTAHLGVELPAGISASWHQVSLWVLDSELTINDVSCGWEVLCEPQQNVSLRIEWSNGATFAFTKAKSARLEVIPNNRFEEFRDEDGPPPG